MSDKKNGYYICYRADTNFAGVDKKIDNQVKVLNLYCDCQKIAIPKEKKSIVKSVMWRMPLGSMGRKYEYAFDMIDQKETPDFLYIRFVPLDRRFIRFLEELRTRYISARIIVEIPAYPYRGELLNNITMFPFYFKDIFYRKQFKRYIDRIATFSNDDEIYGIPTIHIMNGIIVDDIPMVHSKRKAGKDINLIAVACFQPHHGYERCILGMKKYYENHARNKTKIFLHMVGEGSELDRYKQLVKMYKLEKYVLFYGSRRGDSLNEVYDKADIALGSFGFYKIKLEISSVLKVREYLSRGLPIVSACSEDVFLDDPQEFYLHVDNDDSVVDMDQIVEFYERLFTDGMDRKKMAEKIRDYAKRKVDMPVVMQPIIEYILGEE